MNPQPQSRHPVISGSTLNMLPFMASRMRAVPVVALSLVALLTGCGGPEADPAGRAAAEWVIGLGGTIRLAGSNLKFESAEDLPEGEVPLERIDLNERSDPRVTDKDLEKIAALKNLKYLGLYGADVSDKGLVQLIDLSSLEELELSYTDVTGEGLQTLKPLPNLRKLTVHGVPVSKEEADSLKTALPECNIVMDDPVERVPKRRTRDRLKRR